VKKNNNRQKLYLITGNEGQYRVSSDITREFENAISSDHDVDTIKAVNYYLSRFTFRLWKYFGRIKPVQKALFYLRNISGKNKNLFCILMGPRFPKCFPWFYNNGEKAIYLFDAWPGYYDYILKFVRDFSVKAVLVTSRQSADNLNLLSGGNVFHWIPEGIDPAEYEFLPHEKKDIDVLCLGRKHEPFHRRIVTDLSENNINYLFSEAEGKQIFAGKHSFIAGLARTKISVCFPASITHPERAKGIETMTNRYLQSMASKCLVLGKAPREMIDLFGYNPVIEADFEDPSGQIIQILENFSKYRELIERNYNEVIQRHSWLSRWESVKNILSDKGLV
jgi:hypothetical protein